MEEDKVNFDLSEPKREGGQVSRWARPEEFADGGKAINVLSFQRLSGEKGETTAKYLFEGMTYRLTFYDIALDRERMLENCWPQFKEDLATAIRREFSDDRISKKADVKLISYREEKDIRGKKTLIHRWNLVKL